MRAWRRATAPASTLASASRRLGSRRRWASFPAGLGVTLVPASIQRVQVDGVAYRRLLPGERPAAFLNLALRRGDPSAVVRNFFDLVRRAARDDWWVKEGVE